MKNKKNRKAISEGEYLTQYLNEWKEATADLYKGDIMNNFLKIKEGQFDLKSYKKRCVWKR